MRLLSSLIPHSAHALTPAPPPAALPLPHDLVTNISSAASADAFLATLNKVDGTRQLYEGPLKPEPVAAFLKQFAAPAEPAADSATAGEAEAGGAGAAGEEGQLRWVRQMRGVNFSKPGAAARGNVDGGSRLPVWEVKEKCEKTAEELVGMVRRSLSALPSPSSSILFRPHPKQIFVPAFWGSLAIAALCLVSPAHSCLSFPAHSCFSSPAH
ncbi:unnamed protein product [Closterium sp. Naga37s-1]|nr:unnamed protein product [Closterium sp. Naga37s-1]